MIICICNNLTGRELANKASQSKSYEEFMERTRNAGSDCGKCKKEVKNLYNNYNEN